MTKKFFFKCLHFLWYIPLLWYIPIWVLFVFRIHINWWAYGLDDDFQATMLGLTFILTPLFFVIGSIYSFLKKDWILLLSYLVLGGVPVVPFLVRMIIV